MTKKNLCKTCCHFVPHAGNYPFKGWGDCTLLEDSRVRDATADAPPTGQLAMPWDYEGYSAGLFVSPKFGCVQWKSRS